MILQVESWGYSLWRTEGVQVGGAKMRNSYLLVGRMLEPDEQFLLNVRGYAYIHDAKI